MPGRISIPPRSSPKLAEDQASPTTKRQNRQAIFASALGTVVEYYDFAIYGYMATFISSLFFHSTDSSAALLGTFATFAVAFFLRVPGGILFGHIGDKYGRKSALSWTILLMCVSTVGIGLLPTYFTLGIWATVLLVLMRCLQGISAGGELGGATAFAAEYAPRKHRGFQVAIVNVGSNAGSLAAAIVALVYDVHICIRNDPRMGPVCSFHPQRSLGTGGPVDQGEDGRYASVRRAEELGRSGQDAVVCHLRLAQALPGHHCGAGRLHYRRILCLVDPLQRICRPKAACRRSSRSGPPVFP